MYDFAKLVPQTKKDLYNHVNSHDIFRFYFGEFTEGLKYKSPIRFPEESDPSFQITHWNGEYVYRDFALDNKPRDGIVFVMKSENLSYYEAISRIYFDLKDTSSAQIEAKEVGTPKDSFVKFCKKLAPWELEYWGKAHITADILEKFRVYSCRELWFDNKLLTKTCKRNPLYVYYFENQIWKAYCPTHFDQTKKFFSQNIDGHLQGYDLLPEKDEVLFITKSYKDVMVFHVLGYAAIAPHTESIILAPWEMDELKERFDHIYVVYDNDTTGITQSKEFTEFYDLLYWNVPHEFNTANLKTKDPFDLVTNYSYEVMKLSLYEKFERDKVILY